MKKITFKFTSPQSTAASFASALKSFKKIMKVLNVSITDEASDKEKRIAVFIAKDFNKHLIELQWDEITETIMSDPDSIIKFQNGIIDGRKDGWVTQEYDIIIN